jgi:1,4-dihydroxy-2-naphthoyl-CoA hydrolase
MKRSYRIRLADTDAAGRIYFAAAARIAHESFEHFMEIIGFDLQAVITDAPFVLPVVHLEATYKQPLSLGDSITVETMVKSLGDRSVTFRHTLMTSKGEPAVEITLTHAVVSKKNARSMRMPPALRTALSVS